MKPRTLAVLALLALGLGAFIWYIDRDLPSTEERAAAAKKVLAGVEADEVRRVTLTGPDGETVLARVDEPAEDAAFASAKWRIVAPIDARADGGAIDTLVRRLTDLEHQKVLEGVSRADFELESPARRVTFGVAEGADVVLEIGAEAPLGDGVVVAVAGKDPLYLVPSSVATDLDKPAGDWRDRQLFPALRNDVASLRLAPSGVLLAKRADSFWLEAPLTDRADEERINNLFTTLSGARIDRFVDSPPAPAELGLEPPLGVVEAVLEGSETPLRIELGGPTAEDSQAVWARVDGQVVESTVSLAEVLGREPDEWRSRAWTATKSYDIDRISVDGAAGTVEVVRDEEGTDWLRGEENIGYAAVSDLLYAVTSAKGVEVVDLAAVALGETPTIGLTLATKGDERVEGLQLFEVDGAWWARAPGRQALVRLEGDLVDELKAKIAAVVSAEPKAEEPVGEDVEDEEP